MGARIPSLRYDKAQLAQIVERTQAQLYVFVRGFIGDSEEAHDIVQDTYVKLGKPQIPGKRHSLPIVTKAMCASGSFTRPIVRRSPIYAIVA